VDGGHHFDRAWSRRISDGAYFGSRARRRRLRSDNFAVVNTVESVGAVAGVARGVTSTAPNVADATGHGHRHRDTVILQSVNARVVVGRGDETYGDDEGEEGG